MNNNLISYLLNLQRVRTLYVAAFIPIFLFVLVLLFFPCQKTYSQTVLKGGIRTVIEKGHSIEINLNTPINFYFSEIGDKVAAFTKEDILIGDNLYIPKGSRVEGIITQIKKPKHFGQNGAFEIDFNQIITEDKVTIPVYASVTTDTSTVSERVADILTYDSALIAYGTFHGALAGIQYGGLPLAIASHGISALVGAGIGGSFGIIGSIVRKGEIPTVLSSQYIPVTLKSNFYVLGDLPEIQKAISKKQEAEKEEYKGFRFFPSLKKEDIELVINNVKDQHSNIYGDYIVLEFNLKNNSQKTISLSDIVLLTKSEVVPLHPDLFLSGTEALKSIKPFDEINASLSFVTSDKKENYSIAIIDPLDKTEIVKVPLKKDSGKKKD